MPLRCALGSGALAPRDASGIVPSARACTALDPPLDAQVEEVDTNLFRSCNNLWRPARARGVFGGQVVGQALTAVARTSSEGMTLHSLHSQFLLAGDAERCAALPITHLLMAIVAPRAAASVPPAMTPPPMPRPPRVVPASPGRSCTASASCTTAGRFASAT